MGSLLPFQCCCCFRFNKRFARKSIHYKSLQISLLSTIYPLLILLNSNETTTLLILLTTFKKCKKKESNRNVCAWNPSGRTMHCYIFDKSYVISSISPTVSYLSENNSTKITYNHSSKYFSFIWFWEFIYVHQIQLSKLFQKMSIHIQLWNSYAIPDFLKLGMQNWFLVIFW